MDIFRGLYCIHLRPQHRKMDLGRYKPYENKKQSKKPPRMFCVKCWEKDTTWSKDSILVVGGVRWSFKMNEYNHFLYFRVEWSPQGKPKGLCSCKGDDRKCYITRRAADIFSGGA